MSCACASRTTAPAASGRLRPTPGRPPGVGLGALIRRFELDYDGRARLDVRSAPGAGFSVEILIPQTDIAP